MSEDIVLFVGFFTTVLVVTFGFPLMRHWIRQREQKQVTHDAEQLRRIEQAIEAIAIEVERLGEHQRFVARLEQGEGSAASLPEARHTRSSWP